MQLRVSRPAAVITALLICGAGIMLGGTPAGAANPGISLSPSTGLRNGQTVTVTGSGFTKSGTVYIVECKAGATSEGQCSFDFSDLSTVVVAKADASGNLHSPSPTLKSTFKGIDCTKSPCEIAAHQTLSFSLTAANTATHSISFGAATHPSTSHSTPGSSAHASSSAAGQPSTSAGTTGASSSAATSSSSTAASTTASATSAPALAQSSTDPTLSSGSTPQAGISASHAASTVEVKAKNGGRYAVVAIVGVLALVFIAAMARSGRRAGGS